MIVASLLLILAAAVLLVLGLVRGIDLLLVVSIAVSLLAAVALYVGARQSRSHRSRADDAGDNAESAEERAGSADASTARTAVGGSAASRGAGVPELPSRRAVVGRESRQAGVAREFADLDPSGDPDPWDRRPPWPLERFSGPAESAEPVPTIPVARYTDAPGRYGVVIPDADGDDASDDPMDEPPVQRTPRSDAELIARLPAEVLVVDGRPRYHVTGCPHLLGKESEPLPVAEAVELGFNPCGWCQPDTVLLGGTPEL